DRTGWKTPARVAMIYAVGSKRRRPASASGFSLIELIVVLIIMGAATGITVGLWKGLAGLHLKGSGRDVVTALRYARERAISQQMGMKVVFQLTEQRLFLMDEQGRPFRRPLQLNPDVRFRSVRIDGLDLRNRDLAGELNFFPNGGSNRAEIVLENR